MKQLFTFLLLAVTAVVFSQAPQSIPYQAVMRNADGTVISNAAITLTFKIHDVAATGVVVYEETHAVTSNSQGLVSMNVGGGNVVTGTFNGIQWGSGNKFLQVLMNAGNGNIDLGTQQMMSVPYALYAEDVNVRVSPTGDSLFIGNQGSIVPGISSANYLFPPGSGVTDIDGNFYPTVIINEREWMAKNLMVTKYRNGDIIKSPGWSSIYNNPSPCESYDSYYDFPQSTNGDFCSSGELLLYNWFVTIDERGVCPTGWHIPNETEWNELADFLDPGVNPGDFENSNIVGEKLKERGLLSGFNAILDNSGYPTSWWALTGLLEDYSVEGYGIAPTVYLEYTDLLYEFFVPNDFAGIRCIKDTLPLPKKGCLDYEACNYDPSATQYSNDCIFSNVNCIGNDLVETENCLCSQSIPVDSLFDMGGGVTDIEGNYYSSVVINNQEWMQSNLKVHYFNNGDTIINGLFTCWNDYFYSEEYPILNSLVGGVYYSSDIVMDERNVCPVGWHIPNDTEWNDLGDYLGGKERAGKFLKNYVFGGSQQGIPNGFNAIEQGNSTNCEDDYASSYWWALSAPPYWSGGPISYRTVGRDNGVFGSYTSFGYLSYNIGLSIRCIKD